MLHEVLLPSASFGTLMIGFGERTAVEFGATASIRCSGLRSEDERCDDTREYCWYLRLTWINHDGGGKRPAAMPNLPTSLEPSSLMVGEAGDFKCLRDPPQALSVLQGGRGFFFWPHATGYVRVGGPRPAAWSNGDPKRVMPVRLYPKKSHRRAALAGSPRVPG